MTTLQSLPTYNTNLPATLQILRSNRDAWRVRLLRYHRADNIARAIRAIAAADRLIRHYEALAALTTDRTDRT